MHYVPNDVSHPTAPCQPNEDAHQPSLEPGQRTCLDNVRNSPNTATTAPATLRQTTRAVVAPQQGPPAPGQTEPRQTDSRL